MPGWMTMREHDFREHPLLGAVVTGFAIQLSLTQGFFSSYLDFASSSLTIILLVSFTLARKYVIQGFLASANLFAN